jgi:hypothetical protein
LQTSLRKEDLLVSWFSAKDSERTYETPKRTFKYSNTYLIPVSNPIMYQMSKSGGILCFIDIPTYM